jgi:hypothetical protein
MIIFLVFINGCNSGSSTTSENRVSIVQCSIGWTTLNTGATITSDPQTQLLFDQNSNNNKRVCVKTGSAVVEYL